MTYLHISQGTVFFIIIIITEINEVKECIISVI